VKLPVLSPAGAAFVGAFEGFEAVCYDDGGRPGSGNCTIGYGHLVHYGPTSDVDRRRWGAITRAQAARLLQRDAHTALYGIERHVTIRLTQNEVDALCSFAYNCGADALAGGVGEAVNSKPRIPTPSRLARWRARVAAALARWDHAGGVELAGLKRRRQAEAVLFATGRYTLRQHNPYANA